MKKKNKQTKKKKEKIEKINRQIYIYTKSIN